MLTAVAATAFAFVAQTWAQSHLSASATGVVFTTEPVFAASFAALAGEHMGWAVVGGGGLVVASILVLGIAAGRDGERSPLVASGVPCTSHRGAREPVQHHNPVQCDNPVQRDDGMVAATGALRGGPDLRDVACPKRWFSRGDALARPSAHRTVALA